MIYVQNNNARIAILKEISDTISSTDNPDSITNLVLKLGLDYTTARHGSVLLLDDKGELAVRAARGINPDVIPSIKIKIGEKICGRVAKEKTPLLVRNINTDYRTGRSGNGRYKTDSFICCPILMRDNLLGIINIADKADGTPFTEEELDLIKILAGQTAISLGYARLSAELRSTALKLDERNRAMIDSERSRSEFAAAMSHEFRTPLNSIAGAAYYLKKEKVSPADQKEFARIISAEIKKLTGLLDGVLDFSLLEKEEHILERKVLNFRDVLRELITSKTVKDILARNNISISASCPETLPFMVGEEVRLIQAFTHLIDGIGKYASAGDSIALTAACRNTSIQILMLIKGRRVPETELPFLFDNRSPWTDMNEIKSRLRFYLAKNTIEMHKGSVSVLNAPGGISIEVTFPRHAKEQRDARINELANLLLCFTAETMNLNKCSLMLKDELTGELVIKSAIGFDEDIIRKTRVRTGDNIAGRVAADKKPLLIEDIERHPGVGRKNSLQYTTKSLLSLPIFLNRSVIGVLNLNNKASGLPFDGKDLYFASALTERISRIIEKTLKEDVTDSEFKTAVKNLETLLYAEHQYRKKNGELSTVITGLMRQMRRSEDEISSALYSAAFYDLGLTQIDERILMKPGKLSPVEEKIIKTHPFPSVGLIDYLEGDDSVKNAILHHHERFDGLGYPDGLQGARIPFLSRVLGVADAYTAMTSDRPYRKAFSKKEAKDRIKAGGGKQFDPDIVDAFLEIT
ncbi:MAG: GAF domain-containing protein [Nitrospiraceae bacterium]|nr:MAG: GAF domain-containing protein [Nitrospiraceae bacterium]